MCLCTGRAHAKEAPAQPCLTLVISRSAHRSVPRRLSQGRWSLSTKAEFVSATPLCEHRAAIALIPILSPTTFIKTEVLLCYG